MNIALWVIAGLLAFAFLAAGLTKLAQPRKKLAASPGMGWTEYFSPGMIKLIGLLEKAEAVPVRRGRYAKTRLWAESPVSE